MRLIEPANGYEAQRNIVGIVSLVERLRGLEDKKYRSNDIFYRKRRSLIIELRKRQQPQRN